MRRGKHETGHPELGGLHKIGPPGHAPLAVPPSRSLLVEPPPVGQSADEGAVWSPTMPAPRPRGLEANAAAQLGPVRQKERPQLGVYRHGNAAFFPSTRQTLARPMPSRRASRQGRGFSLSGVCEQLRHRSSPSGPCTRRAPLLRQCLRPAVPSASWFRTRRTHQACRGTPCQPRCPYRSAAQSRARSRVAVKTPKSWLHSSNIAGIVGDRGADGSVNAKLEPLRKSPRFTASRRLSMRWSLRRYSA